MNKSFFVTHFLIKKYVLKLNLILFLSLLFGLSVKGQIQNGDFEDFSSCPTNFSQPGDYQLNYCTDWYIPTTDATSDYFNRCSIGTSISVPSNVFGYQEPYSGDGYVGLGANLYTWNSLSQCFDGSYTAYYREYIQQEINLLEKDSIYYITFYVSLADTVGGYAVKNIGLKFSEENLQSSCFRPIVATPDILSPDFVTDKQNWVKVEGYYKASGSEKFVIVGNFRDTLEFYLDTLCTRPNTDWQDGSGQSYYYIDGISIQKVPLPEMPNVFTPNEDGTNDIIDFSKYCISTECHVTVINRWGNVVFDSNDGSFIWNGKIHNEALSDGVYFYLLETKSITKQGFIYLNK